MCHCSPSSHRSTGMSKKLFCSPQVKSSCFVYDITSGSTPRLKAMIRFGFPALSPLGEDCQLLVIVADPRVASVDPVPGHLLAVPLPVLGGDAGPLAHEVEGDLVLPPENQRCLLVSARSVAGEVEHERDVPLVQRLVEVLDEVARGAGLARFVAGEAIVGLVGRDHEPRHLHDGEDHVPSADLGHGIGEALGVELLDGLVPWRLAPEAVNLSAVVLEAVEVMHEHPASGLLEPVGVRVPWITLCDPHSRHRHTHQQ